MDIDRINKLTTPKGEVVRIKRKSDGVTIWRKPYLKLYDWIATCGDIDITSALRTFAHYEQSYQCIWSGHSTYSSSNTTAIYSSPTSCLLTGYANYRESNGVSRIMGTHDRWTTLTGYTSYMHKAVEYLPDAITISIIRDPTADRKDWFPVIKTVLNYKDKPTNTNLGAMLDVYKNEEKAGSVRLTTLNGTSPDNSSSGPLTATCKLTIGTAIYTANAGSTNALTSGIYAVHNINCYSQTVTTNGAGVKNIAIAPCCKLRPAIKDDQLGLWDEVEERIYPCTSPETALYGYGKMNPADY